MEPTKEEIYRLYHKKGLSQKELGKRFGMSQKQIYTRMKKYNIPTKRGVEPTKEELENLYWNNRLSQREIGERYNKSGDWVKDLMKKHNIPTKKTKTSKERFMFYVKVQENGCWNWLGSTNNDGYGSFQINKKRYRSHKASYLLFVGEFDQSLYCLHKCDNPSCVNPDHLFLGTQKDNMQDAKRKGRNNKGRGVIFAKLNGDKIREIRKLLKQSMSQTDIAKIYGVKPNTISQIKTGHTWSHIK